MTLHDARKQAFLYFMEAKNGRIIFNWNRIVEIRRKTGCNKQQLENILEELKEDGEMVLKIFRGNIVVELVNYKKKAPQACRPEVPEEKDAKNVQTDLRQICAICQR